jgi:hypothetical protein
MQERNWEEHFINNADVAINKGVELAEEDSLLFADKTSNFVGRSAMCSALQKLGLNRKKKTKRSTQAGTERVLNLRLDYWDQVKNIEPENLVFLDETGVLLGLTRTHARSQMGTRAYSLNLGY